MVLALMYSTVQFTDFIPLFQGKTPVCEICCAHGGASKDYCLLGCHDVMWKMGRTFRHLQCMTVEQKTVCFWVPAPCRG